MALGTNVAVSVATPAAVVWTPAGVDAGVVVESATDALVGTGVAVAVGTAVDVSVGTGVGVSGISVAVAVGIGVGVSGMAVGVSGIDVGVSGAAMGEPFGQHTGPHPQVSGGASPFAPVPGPGPLRWLAAFVSAAGARTANTMEATTTVTMAAVDRIIDSS